MISIIVPVYNEEKNIGALLEQLETLAGEYELLITDGGSRDRTLPIIGDRAEIIRGAKGRAAQCNAAAQQAHGDIFFFLHCDSILEADVLNKIESAVAAGAGWGCLCLRFAGRGALLAFGAWVSNLRVRLRKIVFGDQGIFITRKLFASLGGFPELPLMEDYELSLRLRRRGIAPKQINSVIITSSRRFLEGGIFATTWQMHKLRFLYRRGMDIEQIAAKYKDCR